MKITARKCLQKSGGDIIHEEMKCENIEWIEECRRMGCDAVLAILRVRRTSELGKR